jgi:hypothetical protein
LSSFGPFVPFDAFWLALTAVLVTSARAHALLRHRHPDVWHAMDSPPYLPRRGLAGAAALTRFYWSPRVGALGDADLLRWARSLRFSQVCLAAVLVVLYQRAWAALG